MWTFHAKLWKFSTLTKQRNGTRQHNWDLSRERQIVVRLLSKVQVHNCFLNNLICSTPYHFLWKLICRCVTVFKLKLTWIFLQIIYNYTILNAIYHIMLVTIRNLTSLSFKFIFLHQSHTRKTIQLSTANDAKNWLIYTFNTMWKIPKWRIIPSNYITASSSRFFILWR